MGRGCGPDGIPPIVARGRSVVGGEGRVGGAPAALPREVSFHSFGRADPEWRKLEAPIL